MIEEVHDNGGIVSRCADCGHSLSREDIGKMAEMGIEAILKELEENEPRNK